MGAAVSCYDKIRWEACRVLSQDQTAHATGPQRCAFQWRDKCDFLYYKAALDENIQKTALARKQNYNLLGILTSSFGMVKVKVYPPCVVIFPMLPMRVNDKLLFPLCWNLPWRLHPQWWRKSPWGHMVFPRTEQGSGEGLQALWHLWGLRFWTEGQQSFLRLYKTPPLPEERSFGLSHLVHRWWQKG